MIFQNGQVNKLMVWIIAAVVLVVVVLSISNLGIIESVKGIFPGFNQTTQTPGIFGQVRYDLLTGDVRRYEGGWKEIDGNLEFYTLDRVLTEQDLQGSFESFYFSPSRSLGELYQKDGVRVSAVDVARAESVNPGFFDDEIVFSRGAVITNVQQGGNEIVGHYYIDIDGTSVYLNNEGKKQDGPLLPVDKGNLILSAVNWRDSVLDKPISLGGASFCVTRIDTHYLLVDLTERRTEC